MKCGRIAEALMIAQAGGHELFKDIQ